MKKGYSTAPPVIGKSLYKIAIFTYGAQICERGKLESFLGRHRSPMMQSG